MADEQYNSGEYIKEYRQELARVDDVAQMVLKGHLSIEATLDETLGAIFKRREQLKQTRLSFVQKAKLVRAFVEHEDENFGWPLIFAFNALRNEIAHGQESEKRRAKINELRNSLQGFGNEEFDRFIRAAGETEVIVHAAALSRGFLIGAEIQIRGGSVGLRPG